MAKKVSKKAGKTASGSRDQAAGKSGQNRAALVGWALVEKALGRASAAVKKIAADAPDLEPGAYPVDISVQIRGDMLIEQGSSGGEVSVKCTASAADLLAGVLSLEDAGSRYELLKRAAKRVKDARSEGDGKVRETTRALIRDINTLVDECGRECGLTEEVESKPRAGACKGTPSLAVNGSIGQNTVTFDLDNTSEQGKAA